MELASNGMGEDDTGQEYDTLVTVFDINTLVVFPTRLVAQMAQYTNELSFAIGIAVSAKQHISAPHDSIGRG